jgi:hypothetical protein
LKLRGRIKHPKPVAVQPVPPPANEPVPSEPTTTTVEPLKVAVPA